MSYKDQSLRESFKADLNQGTRLPDYGFLPFEDSDDIKAIDFRSIYSLALKWWWLVAMLSVTTMLVVALILLRLTPVYQASTVLEVKQEERRLIDVTGVENIVANEEFLNTQIELFKSESLNESVIRKLSLMDDELFSPKEKKLPSMNSQQRLKFAVEAFQERLDVGLVGRTRLIKLSFDHHDPKLAADIVNTLAKLFITRETSKQFDSTGEALTRLDIEVTEAKANLERTERKLFDYANENDILIVSSDNDNLSPEFLETTALVSLHAQLTEAKSKRSESEKAYQQFKRNPLTTAILQNEAINSLKEQKILLQAEYLEKLTDFLPVYPDMIELDRRIKLFDEQIKSEIEELSSTELSQLERQFELARKNERNLSERVGALKDLVTDKRGKFIDYNILDREVQTQRAQYDILLQRVKEVSVSDDLGSTLVQVVDEASVPRLPYKPNKPLLLVISFFTSLLLGVGAVFLLETVDDRIKNPDDIKEKLKLAIIGVVPVIDRENSIVEELDNPQSPASEAYSSVKANLEFSRANGAPKVIQITSTQSAEGKSVSSLGVALRYARTGSRVLLIDADLRVPTFLQADADSIGLAGLLTSRETLNDHVQKSKFDNLDFLPSGQIVPNPSEILSSDKFKEVLEHARSNYDKIIIDSPPVLGLADSPTIAACVDGTLLVVGSTGARRVAILSTISRLRVSTDRILGVVLTKYKSSDAEDVNHYSYTYGNKGSDSFATRVNNKSQDKKSRRYLKID